MVYNLFEMNQLREDSSIRLFPCPSLFTGWRVSLDTVYFSEETKRDESVGPV